MFDTDARTYDVFFLFLVFEFLVVYSCLVGKIPKKHWTQWNTHDDGSTIHHRPFQSTPVMIGQYVPIMFIYVPSHFTQTCALKVG